MRAGDETGTTRAARAMLREFDDLMALITGRIRAAVPSYSELLLDADDLGDRNRENVSVVLTCLLEGREPSATELARSARNGERRAVQGVSEVSVIQSFRTAERTLGEEFAGWCTRMQVPHQAARRGRAALVEHLDRLERAMLEAYDAMARRVRAEEQLSEPAMFRRLAAGEHVDTADVDRLAAMLDIDDPDGSPFVAVAVAGLREGDLASVERLRHLVAARLSAVLRTPVLSGTVPHDGGHVALLALGWAEDPADLVRHVAAVASDARLREPVHTAVGEPFTGLSHVGASCRQAIAAHAATAATAVGGEVVLYADALLDVLVRSEPVLLRQLEERYLGPLAEHPDLLLTLRTHLDADLSFTATAAALTVHKNTVVYRLGRVTALTGLDLRRPEDVARAVLALRAAAAHRGRD